jgi:hypothetical protein
VHLEVRDREHQLVGERAAQKTLRGAAPLMPQNDVMDAFLAYESGQRAGDIFAVEWDDTSVEVFG